MKRGHHLAIGLLALALAACGGSGSNGGGGNTDPTPDPTTSVLSLNATPRMEAVLTNPTVDPEFTYVDPLNLTVGDGVTFQLVNYPGGTAASRNVLPATSFETDDTQNRFGLLTTGSGSFQADSSRDSGALQSIVTARYNGRGYSAFYRVNPRQILLRGRVLAETTGAPVYNAVIRFYAPSDPRANTGPQTEVGAVHTAADGTFRVSLPAFNDLANSTIDSDGDGVISAAEADAAPQLRFTIDSAVLPDGFYPSYVFKGRRYDAGSTLCRAVLRSDNTSNDDPSVFVPFQSGDRYVVNATDTVDATNGTILLTPTSAFSTKPDADGCSN